MFGIIKRDLLLHKIQGILKVVLLSMVTFIICS